ncbi:hypothetical protein FB446DRAFT_709129 [Lentinula raphanica]|nr:hypothetical protein FB446DRAFT_709129 [Lentinula raphanica]
MSSFFRLVCILLCVAPTLTGSSLSPRVCVNDVQSKASGLSANSGHLCSRDPGSRSVILATQGSDQSSQKELKRRAPKHKKSKHVGIVVTITFDNAKLSEQSVDLNPEDYEDLVQSNIKDMLTGALDKWGHRLSKAKYKWVNFPSSKPRRCSFGLDVRLEGSIVEGMLEVSREGEIFQIGGLLKARRDVFKYESTMSRKLTHSVLPEKDYTQPKKEPLGPLPTIPEHEENLE